MKVQEILTQHPEVIHPEASLLEAAQKMRRLDVGMLPVCDGERLVGMITDRDITIRGTADGRDPRQGRVRDVMTAEVLFCFEDQDLEAAAELMENRQVRRLPVLDRAKRLTGILSLGDMAVRGKGQRVAGAVLERVSEPARVAVTD
jgi:CBS domain-containing protein